MNEVITVLQKQVIPGVLDPHFGVIVDGGQTAVDRDVLCSRLADWLNGLAIPDDFRHHQERAEVEEMVVSLVLLDVQR